MPYRREGRVFHGRKLDVTPVCVSGRRIGTLLDVVSSRVSATVNAVRQCVGKSSSSKIPVPVGDLDSHLLYSFDTESPSLGRRPKPRLDRFGRFAGLTVVTDRPTARQTTSHSMCNNKKRLKNVGPIHHCEPPHANSPDVASGTVARRLRIDVHDANDNA